MYAETVRVLTKNDMKVEAPNFGTHTCSLTWWPNGHCTCIRDDEANDPKAFPGSLKSSFSGFN